jgi:SnoaL-like domain
MIAPRAVTGASFGATAKEGHTMSSDIDLEQLQRDVRYLKDRLEIQDVIMRESRGVDRHDEELLASCFHEDAVAAYGGTLVPAAEHPQWSNTAHSERFGLHAHHITNHICEIDGDTAYAESYNIAVFLSKDQRRASCVTARYIDELERRNGEWKIRTRRALTDIAVEGDASFLGAYRGRPVDHREFWTKEDLSYQRPIDFSVPSPRWH